MYNIELHVYKHLHVLQVLGVYNYAYINIQYSYIEISAVHYACSLTFPRTFSRFLNISALVWPERASTEEGRKEEVETGEEREEEAEVIAEDTDLGVLCDLQ